jgi:hypothetical protein
VPPRLAARLGSRGAKSNWNRGSTDLPDDDAALNARIAELLIDLNDRPMKGYLTRLGPLGRVLYEADGADLHEGHRNGPPRLRTLAARGRSPFQCGLLDGGRPRIVLVTRCEGDGSCLRQRMTQECVFFGDMERRMPDLLDLPLSCTHLPRIPWTPGIRSF